MAQKRGFSNTCEVPRKIKNNFLSRGRRTYARRPVPLNG